MGKNERQAYLKAIQSRYRQAGKKAKVVILDEFCAVCGYHRKYAIRNAVKDNFGLVFNRKSHMISFRLGISFPIVLRKRF